MISKLPAWTALDAGALPRPSGIPEDAGRVVAILATDDAVEAGWAGACAVALARAWASSRYRVVLADLNLHAPTLHRELGLANGEGLSDILLWGASVRRVAQGVKDGGFYLVSAGTAVADAGSALASPRWAPLCDGFRNAGVTLAVFLPHNAPTRDAVLRQASEVMIVAPETEDLSPLLETTVPPVTAVVGRREASEAEPAPSAASEPVTGAAAEPEKEPGSLPGEQGMSVGEDQPTAGVDLQEAAATEDEATEDEATEHEATEHEVAATGEAAETEDEATEASAVKEATAAARAGAVGKDVPKPLAPVKAPLALTPKAQQESSGESTVEPRSAPQAPPRETVLKDAGTGVARAPRRRRGLLLAFLVLVVVLLGLVGAALLGYRPIPGIPVLSGGGTGPSALRVGAPPVTSVSAITTPVPAVDPHGATLFDRTGRLPA
ncbi:MAG: hypothetical protein LJF06_12590 [Gemmatimonadetes bacterium]|nr:hypothetical protein [Gemmatimonadota bacterium]